MKTYGLLAVCLVACLLVGVAEPRRSRGGSSRGSGKPSRGTSRRQPSAPPPAPASGGSLSHTGLASLSYPGYNSAPAKKISVPDTPKSHDTRPVGWNVNKETSVKKEVSSNAQSAPSNNAGSHSYPASGGQSGSSGSHAYPASGGLSGANGPPAGGQHSYPASNGVSGATGQQHSYPASGANSGAANQQHSYPASGGVSGAAGQPGYPASGGLSGSGTSNQQRPGQAPISPVNSYPVNNQNPHLANNQPYQGNTMGHGAQPPPYSAGGYGGAPGYGAPPAYGHPGYGAPPAYNAPHGYGAPGYGAPPPYGSHGYGGMGGYGGGFGGGGFGGGYGNPLNAYGGYGQQKSSFLSGNKFGLILAGLAVWNLARSGSSTKHYHYYNNDDKKNMDPNGKMEPEAPVMDPILGELSNCTLTITNGNNTDVIAIPCIMASSFAPNAKPGDPSATRIDSSDGSSALNCTITVTTKNGTEIKTDIPCEELSKMAPKENITAETPPPQGGIGLNCTANGGDPALNPCVPYPGTSINPEFPLEVIPLSSPSTTTVAENIAQSTSTTVSPDSTSTTVTSESTTTTTTTTVEPPPMSAETTLKPSE